MSIKYEKYNVLELYTEYEGAVDCLAELEAGLEYGEVNLVDVERQVAHVRDLERALCLLQSSKWSMDCFDDQVPELVDFYPYSMELNFS